MQIIVMVLSEAKTASSPCQRRLCSQRPAWSWGACSRAPSRSWWSDWSNWSPASFSWPSENRREGLFMSEDELNGHKDSKKLTPSSDAATLKCLDLLTWQVSRLSCVLPGATWENNNSNHRFLSSIKCQDVFVNAHPRSRCSPGAIWLPAAWEYPDAGFLRRTVPWQNGCAYKSLHHLCPRTGYMNPVAGFRGKCWGSVWNYWKLLQYLGEEHVFPRVSEGQGLLLLCCDSCQHAVEYVVVSLPQGLENQ